jgi:hypothetical protein
LEEPISLPCQKIVCLKHVDEEKDSNSIFKCCFCNKGHQIDMRKLCANEKIKKLIEKRNKYVNIDSVDFGENNSLGRESCTLFNEVLRKAKILLNDPAYYVHEYFSQLKNKIDLTKEQYIEMIEEKYDLIIQEVIQLENECKLNAKNKVNDLAKLIEEMEIKLNKRNESLKILNFSKNNEWKSMRFDAAKEIKRIEDEIEKYQDNVLLNKDYEFIPTVDKNNFGNFNVRNIDAGKISMDFDLSNLDSILIDSKEFCIIKDIPWVIQAQIETEDQVEYLGFYVKPICDEKTIKSKPIDAECTLQIRQNEYRKTECIKKKIFFYQFEEPVSRGYNFISKEELMNLTNGFYKKETNSILLEAKVKIIN